MAVSLTMFRLNTSGAEIDKESVPDAPTLALSEVKTPCC
jgi:hypothetical protein